MQTGLNIEGRRNERRGNETGVGRLQIGIEGIQVWWGGILVRACAQRKSMAAFAWTAREKENNGDKVCRKNTDFPPVFFFTFCPFCSHGLCRIQDSFHVRMENLQYTLMDIEFFIPGEDKKPVGLSRRILYFFLFFFMLFASPSWRRTDDLLNLTIHPCS